MIKANNILSNLDPKQNIFQINVISPHRFPSVCMLLGIVCSVRKQKTYEPHSLWCNDDGWRIYTCTCTCTHTQTRAHRQMGRGEIKCALPFNCSLIYFKVHKVKHPVICAFQQYSCTGIADLAYGQHTFHVFCNDEPWPRHFFSLFGFSTNTYIFCVSLLLFFLVHFVFEFTFNWYDKMVNIKRTLSIFFQHKNGSSHLTTPQNK